MFHKKSDTQRSWHTASVCTKRFSLTLQKQKAVPLCVAWPSIIGEKEKRGGGLEKVLLFHIQVGAFCFQRTIICTSLGTTH